MNPLLIPVAAIFISTIALTVTILSYRRKAGIAVRGIYGFGSSKSCNDRYVTYMVLENLKDRAVTIFSIYLKIGHNYYIHLEDHEDNPLVLSAYNTYRKNYGPIEFYGFNGRKVDLNNLIANDKIRKQLILSTSDGKFAVPSTIRRWHPVRDYFDNHMTIVVRPILSLHKEKYLGSNVKYVVECVMENDNTEIIPVHPNDHEVSVFRNFRLSKEALDNKTSLNQFLQEQLQNGKLSCISVIVHDVNEWRSRAHEFYKGDPVVVKYYNAFQYFVLGRLTTMYSNWKLDRQNARLRRARDSKK